MEAGIREAKNSLSKLVEAALEGHEVFLTNRGRRVVQIVAAPPAPARVQGRGFLKDKIHLYPGWDSLAEDARIQRDFEELLEAGLE